MSTHLNRRTALVVAGQGMAALLLAACGQIPTESSSTSGVSRSAAPTGASPTAGRVQVTVPEMGSSGAGATTSVATRTRLPITPVASASRATTLHPTTESTTAAEIATQTVPASSITASSTRATATTPTTTAATSTTPHPTAPRTTYSTPSAATSSSGSTSESSTSSRAKPTPTSPSTRRRVAAGGLAGKVVVIDPGHNGANGQHPEIINQRVDGGYGQRNACNTTGTETNDGYTEHRFAWNVATYLRPLLEAAGVQVLLTRSNDEGVGPCTDKRAAFENDSQADAVVSIHGDGAAAEVRGFYLTTAARPPAGRTIAAASIRLATCIAQAAIDQGFPPSNTLGSRGIWTRDDLTGLNRSTRPKTLIECGNMRNATEAALMSSSAGQRRYAQALAQGVFAFLKG